MSRDERLYLADILEACARVQRLAAGRDVRALQADEATWYAVLYSLLTIGEAARHLSAETRALHPEVPWKRVAGFRDVAAHEYFGVDPALVDDIVSTEIPVLRAAIERMLRP